MGFRKFGRSDDQKVLADEKDPNGVRKEATAKFTDKDREELRKENEASDK